MGNTDLIPRDTMHRYFVLFLTLLILAGGSLAAENSPPTAREGYLDLSKWDFPADGPVRLAGEWEFFWKEFRYPGDFPEVYRGPYINVPATWTQEHLAEFDVQDRGWATFRLKVKLPPRMENPTLRVPHLPGDYELYINGQFLAKSGILKKEQGKKGFPAPPGIYRLPDTGEAEIVFLVSQFEDLSGGIVSPFLLGNYRQISRFGTFLQYFDVFLFGSLLMIGMYYLSFFVIRRQEKSALLFGVFAILLGFRSILYGEHLFRVLFPLFPYELEMALGHLTFYLAVPVFLSYIHQIFPEHKLKWAAYIVYPMSLLFSISAVVFPHSLYVKYLFVFQLFTLGVTGYIFYIVIRSILSGKKESIAFIIGFFVLVTALINDMLHAQLIIRSMHLIPFALFFFVFTQAVMLSWRFAKTFSANEILSKEVLETNRSLQRFVPQEFLSYLEKESIKDVSLGDHVKKEMTVLFCDIRNFTFLSEHLTPEENFNFINSYLERMSPVIREYGGFIDKFIGDAIMALFSDSADSAVMAAIEMQERLARYNTEERQSAGRIQIQMGIGIHTGDLMLGTIGDVLRMDTTVISDAVNLTSKIEAVTKQFGLNIAISESTFKRLNDPSNYQYRFIGKVPVKGKKHPVAIFDIFDGDTAEVVEGKKSTLKDFEEAVQSFYTQDFTTAFRLFNKLHHTNPKDGAFVHYIKRIQSLHRAGLVDLKALKSTG